MPLKNQPETTKCDHRFLYARHVLPLVFPRFFFFAAAAALLLLLLDDVIYFVLNTIKM